MELARETVDTTTGSLVLEFGAEWCGICAAAQPDIESALAARPGLRHVKIEDGKGKRLGRTFGIKLGPTLVIVHDGREVARVVRPRSRAEIESALAHLPR